MSPSGLASSTGPLLAAVLVKFALLCGVCGLMVVAPAARVIFNFKDPPAAEVEGRGRSGDVVSGML